MTEVLATMEEDEVEQKTRIETDKLSYEIFSILESKFLFGYGGDDPAAPPPPKLLSTQRGKVCILSIDGGGGGMRGILQGKTLAYLEQTLRSISGDPDARIADFFDLAAGTGVGGLFAAMLFATRDGARPIFRADDTSAFLATNADRFFKKKKKRFLRSKNRTTASVERAMKGAFGEELTLRDTVKPLLVPCYNLLTSAPLVFSRADALESQAYNFRLWEVCRASWAEPGRFEPADVRSVDGATGCRGVDGGLAMSNPAAAAITHVLHNKQEFPFVRGVEDLMVLSLGCGGGELVAPDLRNRKEWARPIARIAADGTADLVDHAVALAFAQCRSNGYVRIQANGSTMGHSRVDADSDPSPENVKFLLGAAEEMLKQKNVESVLFRGKSIGEHTNMEKLDWFAGELVLEHQRRGCRIAPTVAFKQATSKPSD